MKKIDLHIHSTFSDGSLTPTDLIKYAKKKNISAISLTDHDTIDGIKEGKLASLKYNVEFINGLEITANYLHKEIHILGYFIQEDSSSLTQNLQEFSIKREERNKKMLDKMKMEGLNIELSDLREGSDKIQLTRAHFAKALCKKGYCKTFDEAFKKYLSRNTNTFVPKSELSPSKCIDIIHEAKGIATLAHPFRYKLEKNEVEDLVKYLKKIGLDAVETVYSTHSYDQESFARSLSKKYDLKITGGSDFHGEMKPDIDMGSGFGSLFIDYDILNNLKNSH